MYKHTSPNNKVYIGVSTNCYKRWNNGYGYRKNKHLYSAIRKYGWDNFKHEILFTDLLKEDAERKEIELIKEYNSTDRNFGYNRAFGGLINSGYTLSEETRKKLSLSHIGKNIGKDHPNYGKQMTNEQKEKISKSRKGKCIGEEHYLYGKHHSDEAKQKVSKANKGRRVNAGKDSAWYGKNFSEEHKRKISESLTGREFSDKHRENLSKAIKGRKLSEDYKETLRNSHKKQAKKIAQKDLNGNILYIWNSIAEAHRNVGIPKNNISLIINGKKETNVSWGYIWERYEETEEVN